MSHAFMGHDDSRKGVNMAHAQNTIYTIACRDLDVTAHTVKSVFAPKAATAKHVMSKSLTGTHVWDSSMCSGAIAVVAHATTK